MKYSLTHIKSINDIKEVPAVKKGENSLLICFGNDEEIFLELSKGFEGVPIIGASTAGFIHGNSHHEEGVSVMAIEFDSTKVKVVSTDFENWNEGEKVGREIYSLLDDTELSGLMLFSEGLSLDCSSMVATIDELKDSKIPMLGGLAGDLFKYKNAFVFDGARGCLEFGVAAVGFYGDKFEMEISSHSGVTPFGIEREVTKAEDYTIYELDNKPAVEVYQEYLEGINLDEIGPHLVKFPFSITNNYIEEGIIRTPLKLTEDKKGIVFTGSIPQGSRVRLMQSASSKFIDAVYTSVDGMSEKAKDKNSLVVAVSCACRKLVLGKSVDQEAEIICDELEKQGIAGFYSYGEIASDHSEQTILYNQSLCLVAIYEK